MKAESVAMIAARLRAWRLDCGNPSLRDIERMTRRVGRPYPRSTIDDKVNGRSAPSWEFVRTFLVACSYCAGSSPSEAEIEAWRAEFRESDSAPQQAVDRAGYHVEFHGTSVGVSIGDNLRLEQHFVLRPSDSDQ